ncbi:MAG: hypothetical protein K0R50_3385 [Eubacterium sp.]|jgi:hypothetical protein|nr:hypothetical protein [Eubacterium sp.]
MYFVRSILYWPEIEKFIQKFLEFFESNILVALSKY